MKKYLVRYIIDETIVREEFCEGLEEACDLAWGGCPEFTEALEEDDYYDDVPSENEEEDYYDDCSWDPTDTYAEVRDPETGTIMFWMNADGKFGSDYKGGGEEEKIIGKAMRR